MAKRKNTWTPDAVYCHESNQGCASCPVKTIYGIKDCHMPAAVKHLLVTGVSKPKSPKGIVLYPRASQGTGVKQGLLGRTNRDTGWMIDEGV